MKTDMNLPMFHSRGWYLGPRLCLATNGFAYTRRH